MIYVFALIAILTAGALYSSSDPAIPSVGRKPSLTEQLAQRDQRKTEELNLDLRRKEAMLKLEEAFINAAKEGKSLSSYLQMSLNFNAQDVEGKTALMYLAMRYAACADTTMKAELFKDVEALMAKKARAFSICDKSAKNACDYAEGQSALQTLMIKMQKQDYERRTSIDKTMTSIFEIYKPQTERKEK
jgi:hypothetical protein